MVTDLCLRIFQFPPTRAQFIWITSNTTAISHLKKIKLWSLKWKDTIYYKSNNTQLDLGNYSIEFYLPS